MAAGKRGVFGAWRCLVAVRGVSGGASAPGLLLHPPRGGQAEDRPGPLLRRGTSGAAGASALLSAGAAGARALPGSPRLGWS